MTPVETRRIDSLRFNLSDEITRRFKSASERNRWGDRAAARTRIDWKHRCDSALQHRQIRFDGDSIQWERMPARLEADTAAVRVDNLKTVQ